jgi:hypothetical protein
MSDQLQAIRNDIKIVSKEESFDKDHWVIELVVCIFGF